MPLACVSDSSPPTGGKRDHPATRLVEVDDRVFRDVVQINHVRQLMCDIIDVILRLGVRERLAGTTLGPECEALCLPESLDRPQVQSLTDLHRLELLLEDHLDACVHR